MDGLEIAAIAVPGGVAYLVALLYTARGAFRANDLDGDDGADIFACFVAGVLWPVVLPIVGFQKFVTAPPKEKK